MARALPDGNVTFVFTDVEGSTRLVGRDPAAGRRLLRRHHELLESAVSDHEGVVFETVGDAAYAAFADPAAALRASTAMQRAMIDEDWGVPDGLRIRSAVHGGEVERQGAHYFGIPLFVCARLQALVHGGQTVASSATVESVRESPLEPLRLQPLGRHRLKDFAEPVAVFQVGAPGLPDRFPPLRAAVTIPTNLPLRLTSLVGREVEAVALERLLTDHRLVTVLGPGGTGKTSLALEVASTVRPRFPDGVFLVDLAPLAEPALVGEAVAAALDLPLLGAEGAVAAVERHLADLEVLLVIDNWEHLLGAAGLVSRLLGRAPGLRVLATSRVPLRLPAEQRFRLAPLPVPDLTAEPTADAAEGAVRLFLDRALASHPGFVADAATLSDVAELCRRLDGLPLGIELAASRADVLSPAAMLRGLEARSGVLATNPGAPQRQRGLAEAVEWSVGLLPAEVATAFARLGVFRGGFDATDAEMLLVPVRDDGTPGPLPSRLALDATAALVTLADASLLVPREPVAGAPRFGMLETMRAYAEERLAASGEEEATRRAHALRMAELAESGLAGLHGPDPVPWSRRLEAASDDTRAAVEWGIALEEADLVGRIVGHMRAFWLMRTDPPESRRLAERAFALPMAPRWRARTARTLLTLSLHTSVPVPDAVVTVLERETAHLTDAEIADDMNDLGLMALDAGREEDAVALLERSASLSRAAGNPRGEAIALGNLATTTAIRADPAGARLLHERVLSLARRSGSARKVAEAVLVAAAMVDASLEPVVTLAETRDALRFVHVVRDLAWTGEAILCVALREQGDGPVDPRRMARLLGAREAGMARSGSPAEPGIDGEIRRDARSALGERGFELAFAEGEALDLDAAVAYALGEHDPFAEALEE
jgi:predicted ATPase/class 3 adenylate cyclase